MKRKRLIIRQTPNGLWVVQPEGPPTLGEAFRTREEAEAYLRDPAAYNGRRKELPELEQTLSGLGDALGRTR